MDQATALARLTSMTAATTDPVLDQATLVELLELAAVADADGREPGHAQWTPTYGPSGLRDAAAEGWRRKAGLLAARPDVTADGASIKRSPIYQHCLAMAAAYGSRRQPFTIPVTTRAGEEHADAIVVGNLPESDWPDGEAAGSWPRRRAL